MQAPLSSGSTEYVSNFSPYRRASSAHVALRLVRPQMRSNMHRLPRLGMGVFSNARVFFECRESDRANWPATSENFVERSRQVTRRANAPT
jgi:hypothetical protein